MCEMFEVLEMNPYLKFELREFLPVRVWRRRGAGRVVPEINRRNFRIDVGRLAPLYLERRFCAPGIGNGIAFLLQFFFLRHDCFSIGVGVLRGKGGAPGREYSRFVRQSRFFRCRARWFTR